MASAAISSFDPDGQTLAMLTADGRLRVWDAQGSKLRVQCVEPRHLQHISTCLAWGATLKKRKRGKKAKVAARSGVVAIGADDGTVALWDVTKGELLRRLGEGGGGSHAGRVNDVEFSPDGTVLYSCGADHFVCAWDCASGELSSKFKTGKQEPHRVAVSPDGATLAVGSLSIKLFDVSSKHVTRKLSGHAMPVSCLRWSDDGLLLLSGCADRFINVWATGAEATGRDAAGVLSIAGAPCDLSAVASGDGSSAYRVAVVDENGVACLWEWQNTAEALEGGKQRQRKAPPSQAIGCTVSVGESDSSGGVFAALLINDAALAVAHGSQLKPTFATADLTSEDGSSLAEIVLESAEQGSSLLVGSGASSAAAQSAHGSVVLGAVDMQLAAPRTGKHEKEASMGDRVSAMDLNADQANPVDTTSAPGAGSLATLLVQALQSDDAALLGECLQVTDPAVIERTVARLPTPVLLPLLTALVDKFQSRPHKGGPLIVWIRAILTQHASHLMTIPDLVQRLSSFYQTVDSRVAVFKRLLRLSGRLDLLATQIEQTKVDDSGVNDGAGVALAIYNEDEDEEGVDITLQDEEGDDEVEGDEDFD